MTIVSLKNSSAFSLATCAALVGVILLWQGDVRPLSFGLGIFTAGAILGRLLALRSHASVAFLLLAIGTVVVAEATTPVIRKPTLGDVWGTFVMWALWHGESPTMGWELIGLCVLGLGLGIVGIFVGHHFRPPLASSATGHASRPSSG